LSIIAGVLIKGQITWFF